MKNSEIILLVDDDPTTHFINRHTISKLHPTASVISKMNGKEALEYLYENNTDPNLFPSLILLDLNMPKLNGIDFLKEYKKHFFEKDTVIAVVTDSTKVEDMIKLNDPETSPNMIIQKPLNVNKLAGIYYRTSVTKELSENILL